MTLDIWIPLTSLSLLVVATSACNPPRRAPDAAVPETRREIVVDDYHGVAIEDAYRWLEDLDSPETADWIDRQNAFSEDFARGLAWNEPIRERLTALWNYERWSAPWSVAGRVFTFRNNGLQDQSVLWVSDRDDGEARVLIDPNNFSEDGTVSLAGVEVSPDGRSIAYGTSDGGTDWNSWRVRDVGTGVDRDEVLEDTKFTEPSWEPDSRGFYYSRYPRVDGRADDSLPVAVWRHTVGRPQSDDELIWELPEESRWNPYATVTEDGRHLVLTVEEGYNANAIAYRKRNGTEAPVWIFDRWDALYQLIGSVDSDLFFLTNRDAPMGRVIAVDTGAGFQEREVIAESLDRLQAVDLIGGRLVARYLHDAHARVAIFDLGGTASGGVELPGLGSVDGFVGRSDSPVTYYSYADFFTPDTLYRLDVRSSESEVFREARVAAEFSNFETRQIFATSPDGTRVPIFVVHRRGLELDGENPTLLYGYGGFDISLVPEFRVDRFVWVEMGGVLAIANLRGGGEYGEEWHLAGTRERKQNVFDDFIAAAEHLIAEGYTSTPKLAIQGGSNGGLLVGAAMTQRPELFGAALPAVGVMDMLRYHLPSANARSWSSDYGLSENEADFRTLLAYSPLHNLQKGTCYPPTLVTTADHDDRVVPWHSFKFAAALQHAQGCPNPTLIHVETRAGHGAGKPIWMRIEEVAEAWSFLSQALDFEPRIAGGD